MEFGVPRRTNVPSNISSYYLDMDIMMLKGPKGVGQEGVGQEGVGQEEKVGSNITILWS